MGLGKRCQKGKSCGASCIFRLKLCLIDLSDRVGKGLSNLAHQVGLGRKIKPKFGTVGEVEEGYGKRIAKLRQLGKKAEVDRLEREKELTKQRLPRVLTTFKDLPRNIPKGVKVTSEGNIIFATFKTKSKDKVEVSFSPRLGFHFRVNGQISAGSVKSKEGRVQVSIGVLRVFGGVVKSMPEGSVFRTKAYMGDEKGVKRVALYRKAGFSKPGEKGWMYAIKGKDGKLTPATKEQYDLFSASADSVFFSEDKVR